MDDPSYPTITVITPSYNQGRFLEPCLRSVFEQNYPKVEYVVIDGGSTDESLPIIEKYQDRLAFWCSEPDKGQSDAINKGFARANGDLVTWLNADDFYLPGAFEAAAEMYHVHPDAPFYFGDGLRVDEAGNPQRGFFPDGRVSFSRDALIYGLNYILQPATFINRRALMEVGYLDTDLHYGMDTDLWIRLSGIGSPIVIPRHLAATREYHQTKTAMGEFERIEELRCIAKKYSGLSMTPGVLCYFLHTLHTLCLQQPDLFPSRFGKAVRTLWGEAALLLGKYGANHEGFPDLRTSQEQGNDRPFHRVRAFLTSLMLPHRSVKNHDRRD